MQAATDTKHYNPSLSELPPRSPPVWSVISQTARLAYIPRGCVCLDSHFRRGLCWGEGETKDLCNSILLVNWTSDIITLIWCTFCCMEELTVGECFDPNTYKLASLSTVNFFQKNWKLKRVSGWNNRVAGQPLPAVSKWAVPAKKENTKLKQAGDSQGTWWGVLYCPLFWAGEWMTTALSTPARTNTQRTQPGKMARRKPSRKRSDAGYIQESFVDGPNYYQDMSQPSEAEQLYQNNRADQDRCDGKQQQHYNKRAHNNKRPGKKSNLNHDGSSRSSSGSEDLDVTHMFFETKAEMVRICFLYCCRDDKLALQNLSEPADGAILTESNKCLFMKFTA